MERSAVWICHLCGAQFDAPVPLGQHQLLSHGSPLPPPQVKPVETAVFNRDPGDETPDPAPDTGTQLEDLLVFVHDQDIAAHVEDELDIRLGLAAELRKRRAEHFAQGGEHEVGD